MAHIIILGQTETVLDQLDNYHEQVQEAIENDEYEGEQLTQAQNLLSSTESLLTGHLSALNSKVGEFETFLGI